MSAADLIGLGGVGILLVTYLLLQLDRMQQTSARYSLLNAIGAGAILYSLTFDWNLSAALIEGAWLVISLLGLGRTLWLRRRQA